MGMKGKEAWKSRDVNENEVIRNQNKHIVRNRILYDSSETWYIAP